MLFVQSAHSDFRVMYYVSLQFRKYWKERSQTKIIVFVGPEKDYPYELKVSFKFQLRNTSLATKIFYV